MHEELRNKRQGLITALSILQTGVPVAVVGEQAAVAVAGMPIAGLAEMTG